MIRSTTLRRNEYLDRLRNNSYDLELTVKEMIEKVKIQEALLIANRKLYNKIDTLNDGNNKKKQQLILTLNNYFTRMSSRTTPFGLFSSVNFVNNKNHRKIENYQKKIDVDMDWFCKVLGNIEKNKDILNKVKIFWNPLTMSLNSKYRLNFQSSWGDLLGKSKSYQLDIKKNNLLKLIESKTKDGIIFDELVEAISDAIPEVERTDITSYLYTLMDKEILFSELRPKISNCNSLESILNILKENVPASFYYQKINNLKKEFIAYEETSPGLGIRQIEKIVDLMSEILENDTYVKIDLFGQPEEFNLPENIFNCMTDYVEFLCNVLPSDLNRNIDIVYYLKKFEEEFGENVEIPVLTLFDEDLGLGSPYRFKALQEPEINEYERFFVQQLKRKIVEALIQGDDSIDITDVNFEYPFCKKNKGEMIARFPSNFELFSKIYLMEENLIEISPYGASDGKDKSNGRFNYPIKNTLSYAKTNNENNSTENKMKVVELTELTSNYRSMNVEKNYNSNLYETAIFTIPSTKNSIDLSDVVVGIEKINGLNRFYFKELNSGMRITFSTTSMLNFYNEGNFSDISRFLLESSLFGVDTPQYLYSILDRITDIVHVPKIKFKNILLYPERWIILKSDINNDPNIWLENFIKKNKLPHRIDLRENDSVLRLDLVCDEHYQILLKKISSKSFERVLITNPVSFPDKNKIINEYEIECAFNFSTNEHQDLPALSYTGAYNNTLKYLPGEEWFYLKLYCSRGSMLKIIRKEILLLLNDLHSKGYVKRFHYLYYMDPSPHIRLRLKVTSEYTQNILMDWTKSLLDRSILKKVSYDTFYPELGRYGGEALYSTCEYYFMISSLIAIDFLNSNKEVTKIDKILNIIHFMRILGLDYNSQFNLLDKRFEYTEYRNEFNDIKKDVRNNLINFKKVLISEEYIVKQDSFSDIKFDTTSRKLLWDELEFKNSNEKERIIFSLIHLHINRLLINNEEELELMYLIRHSLSVLEYYFKKSGGEGA